MKMKPGKRRLLSLIEDKKDRCSGAFITLLRSLVVCRKCRLSGVDFFECKSGIALERP